MAEVMTHSDGPPPEEAAQDSIPIFDMSTKKKKKKQKKVVIDEGLNEGMASLSVNGGDAANGVLEEGEEIPMDFAPINFEGKKKRKKKVVVFDDDVDDEDALGGEDGEPKRREAVAQPKRREAVAQPWDGSDRDYTYQELIGRAFEFLHGKNPALVGSAGVKKKVSLQLPQVAREGSKKTVFLNFGSICKSIHRQQDHLLLYMSAELGTTGNIQDGGRLVIKGRFNAEAIAKVVKRYMMEYVVCASCRSPDTVLMRDANTRLYFLQCESCGATRSVAQIRQGFRAQIEKRSRTAARK